MMNDPATPGAGQGAVAIFINSDELKVIGAAAVIQ
jgi:hypothetical protein